MKKAIESLSKTIENIEKDIELIRGKSIYDDCINWTEMDDLITMLEKAKTEAIKCLTTLRDINFLQKTS